MQPIKVLVPAAFPASSNTRHKFEIVSLDDLDSGAPVLEDVRAIALAGQMPIGHDMMAKLPNLEIIAKFGVGYDSIDVTAATHANIVVTNTPSVLTEEVADFTLGLLLATVREIPQADRFVRDGLWRHGAFRLTHSLRDRRIGLLGLGSIGGSVARRLVAMGLDVAYCTRNPKPDSRLPYYPSPLALAEACDVLVALVPGGRETEGIVDAAVLKALGQDGIFINVSRGSVVDQAAMITALKTGTLAAAGLDVFLDEPDVPAELTQLENVVLLPHYGSGTVATRQAMGDRVYANLDSWFSGEGPLNPVN